MVKLFDIESLALPEAEIRAMLPPFNEDEARASVPRNYRKPEAISGWIEEQRANWGNEVVEKAALNPLYSRVVLVTTWNGKSIEQLNTHEIMSTSNGQEAFVVEIALKFLSHMEGTDLPAREFLDGRTVLGWNILGYDIPYLVKRAWILGIPVLKSVFNPLSRYPVSDRFVDLMQVFQGGDRRAPYTSLDTALRTFGLPPKTHDGSEFGRLWAEDREKACAYAAQEMGGLMSIAKQMGVYD